MVPQPARGNVDPVQLHRICESRRLAKAGVLSPRGLGAVHSNYAGGLFYADAPTGLRVGQCSCFVHIAFRVGGSGRSYESLTSTESHGLVASSTTLQRCSDKALVKLSLLNSLASVGGNG